MSKDNIKKPVKISKLRDAVPRPSPKGLGQPRIPSDDPNKRHVAFCFKDIDPNQGATLQGWESDNLLPKMVHRIADICHQTMGEARQSQTIKAYGDFPSRSEFYHPSYVTQEAEWAAIHLQGKEILGGHIEKNIFHVVFLDSGHNFCISNFRDRNPQRRSQ